MNRLLQAWVMFVVVLALACAVVAQPTFGGPKAKPKGGGKPGDPAGDKAPDKPDPTMPGPATPGTQTPQDWNEDDPPRKAPDFDAKPGEYFCSKTADGLRYAWSLPSPFVKGKAYDLIVMIHPDKMDFRWGPANHLRGEDGFRPDCLVVSVDGLGANARRPEARSFDPTAENCVRFRDVLLEFSRNLPVRRIFLYGQGGGGKFAAYFSGAFPALADGVLVHGTAIADNSAIKSTVPIVFMHGAKDSITSVRAALESKQAYDEAGHKGVRIRILRGYNDYPNMICAGDCIDYLRGMRTDDPAESLDSVKRILQPKGPDEFGYRACPWWAGATEVLGRFHEKGQKFDKDPTPEQLKLADGWIEKIEAEGTANASNVRTLLKAGNMESGDFALDGGAWLGYLIAIRDDFRGVRAVEDLAKDLKFDDQAAKHAEAAQELWQTWQVSGSDATKFERAVQTIPKCYLWEALPVDLLPRCRACMKKADELEIDSEQRNLYEFITLWDQGWKDGLEAYELRWQRWSGE